MKIPRTIRFAHTTFGRTDADTQIRYRNNVIQTNITYYLTDPVVEIKRQSIVRFVNKKVASGNYFLGLKPDF